MKPKTQEKVKCCDMCNGMNNPCVCICHNKPQEGIYLKTIKKTIVVPKVLQEKKRCGHKDLKVAGNNIYCSDCGIKYQEKSGWEWLNPLTDLIEKECDLYDTRPKKERKNHPLGECYMNDIIAIVQKALKQQKEQIIEEIGGDEDV